MNDQDYVREAVELADWFEWGQWLNARVDPLSNSGQMFLDALAAQLVRQCDEKGQTTYSEVLILALSDKEKYQDVERSIGTIKAIIDSGVLSEQ